MLYTSVKGGTRAGWRIQREQRGPWVCICGEENPRYRVNCGGCKSPRGDA